MAQAAGCDAAVDVDGSTLTGVDFTATEHGADLETTNFESNAQSTALIGIQFLNLSFSGVWDSTQVPTNDPPGLYVRNDLPNTTVSPAGSGGDYSIPTGRLAESTVSGRLDGLIMFGPMNVKSNGDYSTP